MRNSSFMRSSVSLKEDQRFVIFEIADVLAQKGVMILGKTERVLQFGAAGQDFSDWKAQRDGIGSVAARTAQDALLAFENAHHGIVHAGVDVAVVKQESVGDAMQARARPRDCR